MIPSTETIIIKDYYKYPGQGTQDGHLDFHTAPWALNEDVPTVEFMSLVSLFSGMWVRVTF